MSIAAVLGVDDLTPDFRVYKYDFLSIVSDWKTMLHLENGYRRCRVRGRGIKHKYWEPVVIQPRTQPRQGRVRLRFRFSRALKQNFVSEQRNLSSSSESRTNTGRRIPTLPITSSNLLSIQRNHRHDREDYLEVQARVISGIHSTIVINFLQS